MDDIAHHGRFFGREAADVLRHAPQLLVGQELVLDEIAERRHRGAVEAGAQPVVDVLHRAAAVEAPVLVQIRREDWVLCVVFEGRRGRSVTAPLITMTLAAADRIVELPSHPQRFSAAAASRLAPERDRLRPLGRIGKERRECLDVRQHVAALAVGEPGLPARHCGAEQPFIYRAQQVGVGRELPARRRANLINRTGEIAGRRDHVTRARAIAGTVVTMAAGAPFGVDLLPRARVLCSNQRDQKECGRHLLLTSQVLGFQPV